MSGPNELRLDILETNMQNFIQSNIGLFILDGLTCCDLWLFDLLIHHDTIYALFYLLVLVVPFLFFRYLLFGQKPSHNVLNLKPDEN